MNARSKLTKADARYIWHAADTACSPALAGLSECFGLTRLNCPREAARGPAVLLYQIPEHYLYQALLQDQAPAAALTAWSAQAREILQAVRTGGPQVAAVEMSQFLLFPQAFIKHLGLAGRAVPDKSPVPAPPTADDPVLLALAAACLQQDSAALGLANALQHAALPPAAPSPADHPDLTAAVQSYRSASAQIALLQEQKNMMHQELEILQTLNRSLMASLQQRVIGKEQALQAAGRKIRSLEARATMLQNRLLQGWTPANKRRPSFTTRTLRLLAPLRGLYRNQARREQANEGRR